MGGLAVENTPTRLIKLISEPDFSNCDMQEFHDSTFINKNFSVLMVKKFYCKNNHLQKIIFPSLGLVLQSPKEEETLEQMIRAYFTQRFT